MAAKYSGGFTRQNYEQVKAKQTVMSIKIADIDENKDNEKLFNFNEEELQRLESEIEKHGLISPILVYRKGNRYEVVSGHRRLRAFKRLGKKEINAIVQDMPSEAEKRRTLITSNLLNRTLTPMDVSRALEYHEDTIRLEHGKDERINVLQILSEEFGMSESTVVRYRKLLKLIPDMQKLVEEEKIPWRSGVVIADLPESKQKAIYKDILEILKTTEEEELSANQVDTIVKRYTLKPNGRKKETIETEEDISLNEYNRPSTEKDVEKQTSRVTAKSRIESFSDGTEIFLPKIEELKKVKKASAEDKKLLSDQIKTLKKELKEIEELIKTW